MLPVAHHRNSGTNLLILGGFCLALSLATGCARQEPLHSGGALGSAQENLPFHQDRAVSDDSSPPAVPSEGRATSAIPFRSTPYARVLPSGTLLTVQLQRSLSFALVHSGDTFSASVAAPFVIAGHILVDRGALVTGRVESAQSGEPNPDGVPNPGYLRLSLVGMTLDGRQVELRTSSLFVRGNVPRLSASASAPRMRKGRRLTFRLTAPAFLGDGDAAADRLSDAAPDSE